MATISRSPIPKPKVGAVRKPKQKPFVSLDGRIRVEDWAKLPETKPHYELIDGILKQKMPTRHRHAYAASRLMVLLTFWGETKGWQFFVEGCGIRADDFNGFVPDVSGFTPQTALDPDAVYESSAFLVAEVASPSTVKDDRDKKMKGYARAEVEIYILIDAAKKIFEVYRLEDDKYGAPEILKQNEVWEPTELKGLRLELQKLWM